MGKRVRNGWGLERRLVMAVIAASVLLPAQNALAQSCQGLAAQYASLTQSIQAASKSRYGRAYQQQSRQLDAARADYRRHSCRSLFGHSQKPHCVQLRQNITAMETNLARFASRGGGGAEALERQRRAISTKMRRNKCGNIRVAAVQPQATATQRRQSAARRAGTTYRTLCVRSCDGYYFPVSFSTTKQHFGKDAARCQAMCPAAQVDLYSHRNPGEGPEDMVSMSGLAYADMTTAFAYRTKRVPDCSCRKPGMSTAARLEEVKGPSGERLIDVAPKSAGKTPVPQAKLPFDEDPETIANLRGDLNPSGLIGNVIQTTSGDNGEPREIRIVGPRFFPDQ